MKKLSTDSALDLEFRIELLKERIYATLALLAVLLTIDAKHASPLRAALIVGGTALSLWAASLVAAQMSYRVVMQRLDDDRERNNRQLLKHAPLLVAAVFPLFVIGLAAVHVISLGVAINVAIGALLLLLFGWSLLSVRALRGGLVVTLILTAIELGIGLAIVGLKIFVGH